MKQYVLRCAMAVLIAAGCAGTAAAWGPRVQVTIVNTALHLISREQNLPLTRLREEVRAGAEISPIVMENLFPDMQNDPMRAIENEMALLTAVHDARIDAYFAWRLGALGKLVSRVTAPMSAADPDVRGQYYSDAESAVDTGSLKPEKRRTIDSPTQFERIIREANAGNDLIISEYAEGTGFRGAAAARVAVDISRSVNTVADVWWTVITSRTVPGNISDGQLRQYVLKAFDYYIERGNTAEIDTATAHYNNLVAFTPDMNARIGDLFYEAGMRERAVRQYEEAVAAAPDRRDIVEKISKYHYERAEEALEQGRLEEALAGFEKALETNLLHPTAEQRRLEVAALIRARDDQMEQYRRGLQQADELRQLAEEEAARSHYAEAVALLKQSEEAYTAVGDEFPAEAQRRTRGLRDVQTRTAELRQNLLNNTLVFSGAGFAPDINLLIREKMQGLDKETLRTLVRLEYEAEVQRLNTRMQSVLSID